MDVGGTNKVAFESHTATLMYRKTRASGLTAAENHCLSYVPLDARGAVLDVGIGSGRTTAVVAPLFESYVGIDYSEPLLTMAQSNFPGMDLRVMDARRLDFDTVFDCVIFSFNGIDAVDADGRRLILSEIARVLKGGGYFIYSTHHAGHARVETWMTHFWVRELLRSVNILQPLRVVQTLSNRVANFTRQSRASEPGMLTVNDLGLSFSTLIMYVDPVKERTVLEGLGLSVEAMVGNGKDSPGYDERDAWVYIVARKCG